ncbi:hypothetical protein ACFPRL_21560 [Pseudoclavibacter helvolus]
MASPIETARSKMRGVRCLPCAVVPGVVASACVIGALALFASGNV